MTTPLYCSERYCDNHATHFVQQHARLTHNSGLVSAVEELKVPYCVEHAPAGAAPIPGQWPAGVPIPARR